MFSKILHEDSHNGADGYMIRSVYFDTPGDLDYYEKEDGSDPRKKIRFRCYSPGSDFAVLEMKQKQGNQQRKRSFKMPREEVERCISGDFTPLLDYGTPFTLECFGLMNRECYRPKAIIEYHRKAYVAKENNIRVTFDRNIMSSNMCNEFFSENLWLKPAIDPFSVTMEVKYDGFMLSYIMDLIKWADVSPLSAGKYSAGRF